MDLGVLHFPAIFFKNIEEIRNVGLHNRYASELIVGNSFYWGNDWGEKKKIEWICTDKCLKRDKEIERQKGEMKKEPIIEC